MTELKNMQAFFLEYFFSALFIFLRVLIEFPFLLCIFLLGSMKFIMFETIFRSNEKKSFTSILEPYQKVKGTKTGRDKNLLRN